MFCFPILNYNTELLSLASIFFLYCFSSASQPTPACPFAKPIAAKPYELSYKTAFPNPNYPLSLNTSTTSVITTAVTIKSASESLSAFAACSYIDLLSNDESTCRTSGRNSVVPQTSKFDPLVQNSEEVFHQTEAFRVVQYSQLKQQSVDVNSKLMVRIDKLERLRQKSESNCDTKGREDDKLGKRKGKTENDKTEDNVCKKVNDPPDTENDKPLEQKGDSETESSNPRKDNGKPEKENSKMENKKDASDKNKSENEEDRSINDKSERKSDKSKNKINKTEKEDDKSKNKINKTEKENDKSEDGEDTLGESERSGCNEHIKIKNDSLIKVPSYTNLVIVSVGVSPVSTVSNSPLTNGAFFAVPASASLRMSADVSVAVSQPIMSYKVNKAVNLFNTSPFKMHEDIPTIYGKTESLNNDWSLLSKVKTSLSNPGLQIPSVTTSKTSFERERNKYFAFNFKTTDSSLPSSAWNLNVTTTSTQACILSSSSSFPVPVSQSGFDRYKPFPFNFKTPVSSLPSSGWNLTTASTQACISTCSSPVPFCQQSPFITTSLQVGTANTLKPVSSMPFEHSSPFDFSKMETSPFPVPTCFGQVISSGSGKQSMDVCVSTVTAAPAFHLQLPQQMDDVVMADRTTSVPKSLQSNAVFSTPNTAKTESWFKATFSPNAITTFNWPIQNIRDSVPAQGRVKKTGFRKMVAAFNCATMIGTSSVESSAINTSADTSLGSELSITASASSMFGGMKNFVKGSPVSPESSPKTFERTLADKNVLHGSKKVASVFLPVLPEIKKILQNVRAGDKSSSSASGPQAQRPTFSPDVFVFSGSSATFTPVSKGDAMKKVPVRKKINVRPRRPQRKLSRYVSAFSGKPSSPRSARSSHSASSSSSSSSDSPVESSSSSSESPESSSSSSTDSDSEHAVSSSKGLSLQEDAMDEDDDDVYKVNTCPIAITSHGNKSWNATGFQDDMDCQTWNDQRLKGNMSWNSVPREMKDNSDRMNFEVSLPVRVLPFSSTFAFF